MHRDDCPKRGVWQFCPWCGQVIAKELTPRKDRRSDAFTVQDIGRMRREGHSWGKIAEAYGYARGNGSVVQMYVLHAWRDLYLKKTPPSQQRLDWRAWIREQ